MNRCVSQKDVGRQDGIPVCGFQGGRSRWPPFHMGHEQPQFPAPLWHQLGRGAESARGDAV